MPKVAMSSWTFHEALGCRWNELHPNGKQLVPKNVARSASLNLLDLPREIASHGIKTIDICHFHLPSIDSTFLKELKDSLAEADVELVQLLIDSGELSNPDPETSRGQIEIVKRWMEVASQLGAIGVRYVPGAETPSVETIAASVTAFRELADFANSLALEPATENFKNMNKQPGTLLEIIDRSERSYGLVADFGNARGPDKYETLSRLLPRATSIHAWANCDENGMIDSAEFRYCLEIALDAGFDGPILLLGARPPDVFRHKRGLWQGTNDLWDEVESVFGGTR
jgi:sugar phosphate isomerase/epimerase